MENRNIDFTRVTACGECCVGCKKKEEGLCQGCIESRGNCIEWTQSGGCPISKCALQHHVQFCGLCEDFPCNLLTQTVKWKTNIVEELTSLATKYRVQKSMEDTMMEQSLLIKDLEIRIWEAASHRDTKEFLDLVKDDAVMVCGGYRCSGKEYGDFISEFDLATYEIKFYETIVVTDSIVQNHYVITTKVNESRNQDLEGSFHVTSTWEKVDDKWKLIYNMDSRIFESYQE